MLRNLWAGFCLAYALFCWLSGVIRLGPMMLFDGLSGWINRKFEELYKDF